MDAYQVAASWIGNYIRQLQTRNICSLGSEFYFPARKPFLEQFYIHVVGTVIMDVPISASKLHIFFLATRFRKHIAKSSVSRQPLYVSLQHDC